MAGVTADATAGVTADATAGVTMTPSALLARCSVLLRDTMASFARQRSQRQTARTQLRRSNNGTPTPRPTLSSITSLATEAANVGGGDSGTGGGECGRQAGGDDAGRAHGRGE